MSTRTYAEETPRPSEPASGLLAKAGALRLRLPLDLERLAMDRGCDYYERELPPRVPPLGEVGFSNAELAIALIAASRPPKARDIRLAAALLGSTGVRAEEVATLAVEENCAEIVCHIANCGHRFEPDNPFWTSVLSLLPDVEVEATGLPHPTRFVEMTGLDRGKVGISTRWIRPRARVPA